MSETINLPHECRLVWNGPALVGAAEKEARKRVRVCLELAKAYCQKLISVPTRSQGPSKPGEPPHADTGRLRQEIHVVMDEDGLGGMMGTSLPYGLILEHGSPGGKVIEAKNARALHWIGTDGRHHFAKRVVQGPIAPRPFLRRTAVDMRQKWKSVWEAPYPSFPEVSIKMG